MVLFVLSRIPPVHLACHRRDLNPACNPYHGNFPRMLNQLLSRSESRNEPACELCGATDDPAPFPVPPADAASTRADDFVLACPTCTAQMQPEANPDPRHWRCLNESMWSPHAPVQIMAWRMLNRLDEEIWARDALDMLFLDDETLERAKSGLPQPSEPEIVHKDAHGAPLSAGDTVTLIKDLSVKGAGFTAKRGTPVRNISLVPDNEGQIEGRVNGQQIVILTAFVKRN